MNNQEQLSLSFPKYSEKDIVDLCIAVNTLRNEVKKLMLFDLIKKNELPEEMVKPIINSYTKHKLGRPPLEGEIKDAISKTKSMKKAANYLGVSIDTLKHYCKLYERNTPGLILWKPARAGNPSGFNGLPRGPKPSQEE